MTNIKEVLRSIALKYPESMVEGQLRDIDRIAYHIGLVLEHKGRDVKIADIGGGVGLFSVGCAALGMQSLLIDDFGDEVNRQVGQSIFEIHKSYGVEIICKNAVENEIEFEPQSLDVVTTFDSMEHWHRSPKKLFRSVRMALKTNGLFILGVPNCVNLRKRIAVPFGYGKWSRMEDWYEQEIFRGHVREPDVKDLCCIARDMNLKKIRVLGQNWCGYQSSSKVVRFCTKVGDKLLRVIPSLCSDIYLIGFV